MQNNYKLAIFDIDGTLTEIKPEVLEKYPKRVTPNYPNEQQPIPGVPEKLTELKDQGIKIALATNRGGVAWGYTPIKLAWKLAREAAELCGVPNAPIYLCPYHAKAKGKRVVAKYAVDHECRKPNPGMLLDAMREADIEKGAAIFIGDRDSDKEAAEKAGVRFYWAEEYFKI